MRTRKAPFRGFLLMVFVPMVATLAIGAHTEQALPGDEILDYSVISISTTPGASVSPSGDTLETKYSYWRSGSQHPQAVEETPSGSIIQGMQRVEVSVRLNVPEQSTTELKESLYTMQGNEILSKTFPCERTWRLSDLSSTSPILMEPKIVVTPRPPQEPTPQTRKKLEQIPPLNITKVPDLKGHTVSEARGLLEEPGLQLGEVKYFPSAGNGGATASRRWRDHRARYPG